MDYEKKLHGILEKSGGIITTSMLKEEGIPSIYLTRMTKKGYLERVDRGIYRTSEGDYDEYFFLATRYPRIVFSYLSALYLHGYTDEIPSHFEITVYSGYNTSNIKKNVKVHYIKKEFFDLGKTKARTMFSNWVPTYNIERTICDLISKREKIDVEIFAKAIQNYANSREKDLHCLFEYAEKMKLTDKVRDIMEVQL
ncbi:MAG: type IV toxin-antitoxin system AbiEi family antitoxin domain-containing protein [Bacillota bacterium]|nr:type IV toxin-antitoxin system AbiEi family antitoxin domain-containing protein [Bacillota bacterium]